MSEEPTVFNVFGKELALIQDADIRMFVQDVFTDLCPNYFWYIPASIKGHHPPVCRTRGGLVHHVKLAVGFADTFLDMLGIVDDLTVSQVIAAVLLHDMMRRGRTEDESDTWPEHLQARQDHGRYCADRLYKPLDEQRQHCRALAVKVPRIIEAVRLHMGRWTLEVTPNERHSFEYDVVVRTTHLADYAASRALHQYLAERAVDMTMGYLKK